MRAILIVQCHPGITKFSGRKEAEKGSWEKAKGVKSAACFDFKDAHDLAWAAYIYHFSMGKWICSHSKEWIAFIKKLEQCHTVFQIYWFTNKIKWQLFQQSNMYACVEEHFPPTKKSEGTRQLVGEKYHSKVGFIVYVSFCASKVQLNEALKVIGNNAYFIC